MSTLTGTGALARLMLRRDRIKLPAWILGIVLLLASTASANVSLYATEADRLNYATASATSIVSRVLGGPMSGTSIGAIIMLETFLTVAVLVAFMCSLAVIRHTRQNGETGRAELIGSAVVGRHANIAAVLLVVIGANMLVGVLCTLVLALVLDGVPLAGSVAYGAGIACTGLVFTAVAAVAAQLTEGARSANGIAAAAIGLAFLLRGTGDALGELTANGIEVVSNWLSWVSPLGWGMLMYPFVDNTWWVLGLFVVLASALIGLAILLINHRDLGASMFATRRGPAQASPRLLSPLGLAWRLQRGALAGWLAVMCIVGVGFGAVGKEFESFFKDNEPFAEAFMRLGADSFSDALFAAILVFVGVLAAAYTVQALLRMRAEETGSLELVLAGAVSRTRWTLSHITVVFTAAAGFVLLAGLLAGLTYSLAIGNFGSFGGIMAGASVHIPAVLVVGGFVVVAFALLPRLAVAIAWTGFVFVLLLEQLGLLLKLPQWVLDFSPFTHVPNVPAVAVSYPLALLLLAVAAALTVAGLVIFRRRDLKLT